MIYRTLKLGKYDNPTIDIAMATLQEGKQVIIFCNSKRSAEKTAEDIAKKIGKLAEFKEVSEKAGTILSPPTKQCMRLQYCLERGTAFHHAGLHNKQREIIEEEFKKGNLKIICSTPTLAAGVDMPAFRTVIKDLRRFSNGFYDYIPVLEYHQMAGRAGRPGKEDRGEAIVIAKDESEENDLVEKYLFGDPEVIYSKLAVEPVLRMYVLSLISSGIIRDEESLIDFFKDTFWAFQFGDMHKLIIIIRRVTKMLNDWSLIEEFRPTRMGILVSRLYLDPLTAYHMISSLQSKSADVFGLLHMVSYTREMRPLLRVKTKEYEEIESYFIKNEKRIISNIPNQFDYEYEEFLSSIKTTMFFMDWIDEVSEQDLLEKYSIRPGEISMKIDNADWLLHAASEISRVLGLHSNINEINKLMLRLKYGIREEILPLVKLKDIGRVRARKLYKNGIRSYDDIRKVPYERLSLIIGKNIALKLKEQV